MSLDPNNQTPIRRCSHGVALGLTCGACNHVSGTTVATYKLDIECYFAGPEPAVDNRAAPQVSPAQIAAVDAVRAVLAEHGYTITRFGHGSYRTGSVTIKAVENDG